ncbi:MAG: P1 family peptidase, partial [Actinomycetota bacterium]
RVGAGAGATVGKWAGLGTRVPGGIGIARAEEAGMQVAALAVVNAVGDVVAPDGSVIAGTTSPDPTWTAPGSAPPAGLSGTVLCVVALRAVFSKPACAFIASRGSDGITVAVRPAHTRYDGDVVFAIAAPGKDAPGEERLDLAGVLATRAVAAAIRAAVPA